jgi:hypothetical protein
MWLGKPLSLPRIVQLDEFKLPDRFGGGGGRHQRRQHGASGPDRHSRPQGRHCPQRSCSLLAKPLILASGKFHGRPGVCAIPCKGLSVEIL